MLLSRFFRSAVVSIALASLLACGGGDSDTPSDTTPAGFSFSPLSDQARSTQLSSAAVTISGINTAAPVTITGGSYSIDGGEFTSAAGTINNGQSIAVQLTTSAEFATDSTVTLTIGGVEGVFTVTTEAQDTVPDTFSFTAATDQLLSAVVESNTITIAGINDASPISITGGEYQIVGVSDYSSDAATVINGQQVQVRGTSSASLVTETTVTLNIGGVSADFSITTLDDTTAPMAEIIFPTPVTLTEGASVTVRGSATDDIAGVAEVRVNGVIATDISDDNSWSMWTVNVPLAEGDNTLTVAVDDQEGNSNSNADSVMIERDSDVFTTIESFYEFPTPVLDEDNGRLLVANEQAIYAIDIATGVRTLISDNTTPNAVNPSESFFGAVLDSANNRLYVNDDLLATLFAVNLDTGERTVVFSTPTGSEPVPLIDLTGMVLDPVNNRIVSAEQGFLIGVAEIDITTGARSVISDNTTPNADNPFQFLFGSDVDFTNNLAYVSDARANAIFEVDLITGERQILSDATTPDAQSALEGPRGLDLDLDNNRAVVADTTGSGEARLISVDLATGARTVLSSNTMPNDINELQILTFLVLDVAHSLGYVAGNMMGEGVLYLVDLTTGERVVFAR